MIAKTPYTVDDVKAVVVPILIHYGVQRAGVFGSLARGQTHRRSDVDIVVEFGQPISLYRFVGLKLDLEKALGRRVDLVEYDAIKPLLRDRVLHEQIRIL